MSCIEGLGSSPNSTPNSSFLLIVHPAGDGLSSWSLSPVWEMWIAFWALGFGLFQP